MKKFKNRKQNENEKKTQQPEKKYEHEITSS
jgi:hypothetical protein